MKSVMLEKRICALAISSIFHGAAFGIAINSTGLGGLDLAAVNDATNALSVFELSTN
jgi:hypothetical protein